ncbi:MAG TPA: DNA repair protein RecN [Thermoanaerobacterales bacterium]|nr:DNA repair protein RecN [Thermoanaerobacterales bacterium]
MLLELYVKDFTIIDNIKMEFTEGLNIITGETGAGKSIIIDAISLLLGARASVEYIKTGREKAEIYGIFYINDTNVKKILNDYDIEYEDDVIIISREISDTGKNICRINSKPVNLGLIRQIGQLLIDIHGQHEHQSLLNPDKHIDLLDMFGGNELLAIRQKLSYTYRQYKDLHNKFIELKEKEQEREQKLEFLKFQTAELERANLKPGEEEELNQEKKILSNSERLFLSASTAYQLLYQGDDDRQAVYDTLSETIEQIENINSIDQKQDKILNTLKDIFFKIEDISADLRTYRDTIVFNQDRLNEIETRLNYLNQLKRKYGYSSTEEILDYYKKAKKEIDELVNIKENIDKLINQKNKTEKELVDLSLSLSEKRKTNAKILEREITKELYELGMGKTRFSIAFEHQEDNKAGIKIGEQYISVTNKGIDIVEFLISTNPGEPLKPLSKIISGGEMSRIMLALKSILARVDSIPTLIFDEIDSGISGATAQIVAEKLLYISKSHQTICITHLPQIACMADNHFYIEKITTDKFTNTKIKRLEESQRITELARMLEGSNITDITLDHAKQMIENAKTLNKKIKNRNK